MEELRTAIATQNLAYYMIPERNLMSACGLESEQQRAWVETLTDMLNEGPMVILRFKKIMQAFNSHIEQLIWYSKIRTECEMLLFVFIHESLQCWQSKILEKEGDIDWETLDSKFLIEIVDILIRVAEIIEEVHKRLKMDGIEFYDTYDILVRMMS
ncbi:hypothetical protein DPMN_049832 [Dreissena polymorpha]|uniref:Uncharacterized protein n=1 Tax=Dreissena polymorpha TaxID=45954 RepID=A0A9D4HMI7_DREPO|nr:hypothetical protein DPMN_049832 [Dreissena polymorpha]